MYSTLKDRQSVARFTGITGSTNDLLNALPPRATTATDTTATAVAPFRSRLSSLPSAPVGYLLGSLLFLLSSVCTCWCGANPSLAGLGTYATAVQCANAANLAGCSCFSYSVGVEWRACWRERRLGRRRRRAVPSLGNVEDGGEEFGGGRTIRATTAWGDDDDGRDEGGSRTTLPSTPRVSSKPTTTTTTSPSATASASLASATVFVLAMANFDASALVAYAPSYDDGAVVAVAVAATTFVGAVLFLVGVSVAPAPVGTRRVNVVSGTYWLGSGVYAGAAGATLLGSNGAGVNGAYVAGALLYTCGSAFMVFAARSPSAPG
ncbi:hypothetical protein HKX48_000103 [Thoreauomyces humboldtii]|nr:hypothetical protein HKX48_000103 [Thoreauomyces humboldtii]